MKFFEFPLLNLKISFRKYQNRANTLPSWIIADKEDPGSSIPKKRDITFKWAVLLTGINSVKPWINPYKINFKYSKDFKNQIMVSINIEITIYLLKYNLHLISKR